MRLSVFLLGRLYYPKRGFCVVNLLKLGAVLLA